MNPHRTPTTLTRPNQFTGPKRQLSHYRLMSTEARSERALREFTRICSQRYGALETTYGALYEVYDRRQPNPINLPVSQSNLPIAFHTDSSKRDTLPDIVGLTCVQNAEGGDTLLADAEAAYRILKARHPWVLDILSRDFARAIVTPNSNSTRTSVAANAFPILTTEADGQVLIRYMRTWIETGAKLLGKPLTELELTALDHLDNALQNSVILRHHLRPGECLLFNNRRVVHARTPYRDYPGRRRKLLRVWVNETPCRYMKRSALERSSVLLPN